MKRGDIYWATLDPVIGSEIAKTRPVLIISNDINNQYSNTITVLPLTSLKEKIYPIEVFVDKKESKLKNNSKIKTNQIRTIDKQRLMDKISSLSQVKIRDVEKALLIHLGFVL